jgi:hypothetical protein
MYQFFSYFSCELIPSIMMKPRIAGTLQQIKTNVRQQKQQQQQEMIRQQRHEQELRRQQEQHDVYISIARQEQKEQRQQ